MKDIKATIGSIAGLSLSFGSAAAFGYLLWENYIKIQIYYGGRDTYYHDGGPDLGRGIAMLIIGGLGVLCGIVALLIARWLVSSQAPHFKIIRNTIYTFAGFGVVPPLGIMIVATAIDWTKPLWR